MEREKCAHEPCTCLQAEPFGEYCSAGCKEAQEESLAAETPLTECECGHADCAGAAEVTEEEELDSLLLASKVLSNA